LPISGNITVFLELRVLFMTVQHHSAVIDEDEVNKYIEAPQKKAVKWKDENLF